MTIFQDLAKIERIQAKSQKRVDRFLRRLRKRGHVRMGILGMMALTMDFDLLKFTTKALDMVEVRVVAQ